MFTGLDLVLYRGLALVNVFAFATEGLPGVNGDVCPGHPSPVDVSASSGLDRSMRILGVSTPLITNALGSNCDLYLPASAMPDVMFSTLHGVGEPLFRMRSILS